MRKMLALIIAIATIICSIPAITIFAATVEFAGGSGIADDPYLIATKEQLDNVRNDLSAHYKMIADIEFVDDDFTENGTFYNNGQGWEPMETFVGTFDGNGFSIKNLHIDDSYSGGEGCSGFFKYNSGIIKNLSFYNGTIKFSASATYNCNADLGTVAGCNQANGLIINCNNSCDVYATASASSSYASPHTSVGGIVGTNRGKIEKCQNFGNITASSSFGKDDKAGGIAGSNGAGTISDSYNVGEISGDYVGGIAGKNYNGATIVKCSNEGIVTAYSSSTDKAGGIVGENGPDPNVTVSGGNAECIVENCCNLGDVSAEDNAGGIAGNNGNGKIISSYNLGTISAGVAGGVVGKNHEIVQVCYNKGAISGKCAGGVVGSNSAASKTMNCYNAGTISATTSSRAGGIAGYNDLDAKITNCYNVGVISGTNPGGITGGSYKYNSSSCISECYYLDDLSSGSGDGKDTSTSCTTEEMQCQSTYTGFDFDTVWTIAGNPEYPYPELQVFFKAVDGDVSGDGILDTTDVRLALRSIVGLVEFTDKQLQISDMNGDTKLNSADVRRMLWIISNE